MHALRATVHRDNAASIAMLIRQGFWLADDCYQGDGATQLYTWSPNPTGERSITS